MGEGSSYRNKPNTSAAILLAGLVSVALIALVYSNHIGLSSDAQYINSEAVKKLTKDAPQQNFAQIDIDLERPSTVYGWVDKEGAAAVETWHSSADQSRRKAWDKFLEDRASGAISLDSSYSSVPPHGPDAWGCRLYYNEPYKLFFVRTAKTGSTTILENVLPSCSKRPELLHCLQRVADSDMSIRQVATLWRQFTAFTFTRNVWSRGISQYQYLVHFLKGNGTDAEGERLECPRVTWDDFCRDPLKVGEVCRDDARCCTKKWTHQDWHMRQQTSCFLTEGGEWAVDFIGRLENFDADLLELFDYVNGKREPGLPPLRYIPQPPANSNPNSCSDLRSTNGGTGGRRRLSQHKRKLQGEFDNIAGNQQSDVMYCDKRNFYSSKHERCYKSMERFFAQDVKLLHPTMPSISD